MFLTAAELNDLTGLKQGAAQVRWLRRNGIPHTIRVDGKPSVLSSAINPKSSQPPRRPDFAALQAGH